MLIWVRRILLGLAAVYFIVIVAAFLAQRKFLYFPPEFYAPPPIGWAEVKTETGVLGWHSSAQAGRPTIMVFHGNASSIESNMHIFRDLQTAGYGVWSVGYPGYPGNIGTPTQGSLVKAAIEQYETLRGQGVSDIVFYGTSLGSGVAAQLSSTYAPKLLILDAPFNSAAEMARRQMPFLPTGILMKDTWRSDQALQDVSVPLIWIHGTVDRVIPVEQGQRLFDGYGGPKSGHIIPNAHHTNTWLQGGREIVLSALATL
jgi:pimeloyl-ACP methyl ester carboxylesterase